MNKAMADVIIIGGGIAGTSTALALVRAGLKVILCDKKFTTQSAAAVELQRVSALTPASQRWLQQLQIWPDAGVCAVEQMHVWDSSGEGDIHFKAAEVGRTSLATVVANSVLLSNLQQQLQAEENFSWQAASAEHLAVTKEQVSVCLSNACTLAGKLVIAADGAHSWVRKHLHIECASQSYGQKAIVATLQSQYPHKNTALQAFSAQGPMALLPLAASHQVSLVWSLRDDMADHYLSLAESEFLQHLTASSRSALGELQLKSDRYSFPLTRRHAKNYVQPRVALLGDAIHTIHPLAGQGLNLALLDAQALSASLVEAHTLQRDIGVMAVLRRYERRRKGHNLLMLTAMEGFHRLFTHEAPLLRKARNWGLRLVDKTTALKQLIMHEAMGV